MIYKNKGFTIAEILVVCVILGIVASLAIPKFVSVNEKSICSEAINSLAIVRDAQARYYLDHSPNYDGTTCPNLDITINTKYFNSLTCNAATGEATLTRVGGSYVAHAAQSGTPIYSCTGAGCTAAITTACFSN